jgi:phosphopantetheinyl transferase
MANAKPTVLRFTLVDKPLLVASHCWEEELSAKAAQQWAKIRLAGVLLCHIKSDGCLRINFKEHYHWPTVTNLALGADQLGRPLLSTDGNCGLTISYSHLPGATWIAMGCGPGSVGIDAADSREFSGGYPFGRIFHPSEFECFTEKFATPQNAAAALWSSKEAAVKALGCAYHFFGPIDLKVRTEDDLALEDQIYVSLSARAKHRIARPDEPTICVQVVRQDPLFLAIAWVNSR